MPNKNNKRPLNVWLIAIDSLADMHFQVKMLKQF